jgi:uncharacterized PurR-regulated membrane protein YhhQ (DUF165 family)
MTDEKKGISPARLWNALPIVLQVYLALFVSLLAATVIVWLCDCFIPHGNDAEGKEAHHLFPIFANAFTASFGAVIGALSQWASTQFGKETK